MGPKLLATEFVVAAVRIAVENAGRELHPVTLPRQLESFEHITRRLSSLQQSPIDLESDPAREMRLKENKLTTLQEKTKRK